jgi:hypothetical protein
MRLQTGLLDYINTPKFIPVGREKGSLQELANRVIQQGLMDEADRNLIDAVRTIRNSAAHDAEPYGRPPVAATLVRHTARVLNGMYEG